MYVQDFPRLFSMNKSDLKKMWDPITFLSRCQSSSSSSSSSPYIHTKYLNMLPSIDTLLTQQPTNKAKKTHEQNSTKALYTGFIHLSGSQIQLLLFPACSTTFRHYLHEWLKFRQASSYKSHPPFSFTKCMKGFNNGTGKKTSSNNIIHDGTKKQPLLTLMVRISCYILHTMYILHAYPSLSYLLASLIGLLTYFSYSVLNRAKKLQCKVSKHTKPSNRSV